MQVFVVQADLSDNDSIKSAAKQLNELGHIDLFYNNAGVLLGERQDSKDGIEMSAQVHTIAPYLFGRLLSPSLAGATVLTVCTNGIMHAKPLKVSELGDPPTFKKLMGPYVQTKLATAALMGAFAREYPRTAFISAEPGSVKTPMTAGAGMPTWLRPIRNLFFSSPDKAARRLQDAATRPDIKELSGAFILKGKVKELPKNAGDPLVQADLLGWCKEVTGV
jgi:NAD(P)-dependent dehydrogenase (short-subunit alcohol dehydrogenase family)